MYETHVDKKLATLLGFPRLNKSMLNLLNKAVLTLRGHEHLAWF
jgi:hypothetical protein